MTNSVSRILPADLDDTRVILLLTDHVRVAREQTEPGSAHALDISGLRMPAISVWTAWIGEDLAGAGALKRLSAVEGEIKSMYTAPSARRQGVALAMLTHIIETARSEGMRRLSLETGSWSYFEPARRLYAAFGFSACGPFGDYREDPNSVFMTLDLTKPAVHALNR
jgi:putative acetyltransferase